MKEEIKELILSITLMATGVFARSKFDTENKYTLLQIVALLGVGVAIILILNQTNLSKVTVMSITLLYGLLSPSVLRVIIKAGNKSENKAADKMSDKIDKFID